jgi:hypothetical protein
VYALLTETGKRQLRIERIAGLEGDHFRVSLQLEEAETADEVGALSRQSADLERRLRIHRDVLNAASAAMIPDADTRNEPASADEGAGG